MRAGSILILVKFLLVFIARRVLGRGVLRSKPVRWTIFIGLQLAFIAYCILSFTVLRQFFSQGQFISLLLKTLALSVPFWVGVVYVVIRVLFMRADALIQLTFNLPVTNRERALAFSTFEALVVSAVLSAVFGAFVISAVALKGPSVAALSVTTVVLPSICSYVLVNVAYIGTERLLVLLGIARARGLVLPLGLAALLVWLFKTTTVQTQDYIVGEVTGHHQLPPQLLFYWLDQQAGLGVSVLAAIGAVLVVLAATVLISPKSHVPLRRNFHVLQSRLARFRFGVYVLAQIRSFETSIVVLFVLVGTAGLVKAGVTVPPFALLFLTFQGVYAFTGTDNIRRTVPKLASPAKDFFYMVLAQFVVYALVAVPVVAVAVYQHIDIRFTIAIFAFGLGNMALTTLVGIAFPADNGNPFSVLIGVVVMVVVLGVIGIGLNIFNMPAGITALVISAISLLASLYGIVGLRNIERNRRHEMVY